MVQISVNEGIDRGVEAVYSVVHIEFFFDERFQFIVDEGGTVDYQGAYHGSLVGGNFKMILVKFVG